MLKTFKTIFRYNWKYKWPFLGSLGMTTLVALLTTASNIIYKYFIDGLDSVSLSSIIAVLVIYLIVLLSIDFLNTAAAHLLDMLLIPAVRDLRIDVFNHLHSLDISFHENKQSGVLISRIKRGDGAYFTINHDFIFGVFTILLKLLFFTLTFVFLKIEISAVIVIIIIISFIATYFLLKHNLKTRKEFNKEEDNVTHVIVDNMINYDTVKYFAREKFEGNRLVQRYIPWTTKIWDFSYSFRTIDVVTGIISIAGIGTIMLMALTYKYQGILTTGDIVMTIGFVSTLFPELKYLIFRLRNVIKNYADAEKYISMLDYKIDVKEKINASKLDVNKGEISFTDVDFKYKSRDTIFENFNLDVTSGESLAFVGESGAGKTTLTKLLLRFYDITSGKIQIDGQDIKGVTKESLRKSIGVVPQEPILFNDTIGYNLGYGKDNPSIDSIKQAAKFANLAKFIETLPNKYDTVVGERGIKLSGGQKQRLAIARMFLADPPIIIFDEATSQLDSKSEKLIQDAFWKLAENRTTLIIAHRLSTVMRADRIVVLDGGKIVQQGTHVELANQPGVYKTLWDIQKGDFVL